MKNIFKKTYSRVWFIVSAVLLGLVLVANIVINGFLSALFDNLISGKPAIVEEGEDNAIYLAETENKADALAKANEKNIEINKEGIVLLKNENNALPIATPVSDQKVSAKPKISVFGKNSVDLVYGGSGSGGIDDVSKAKTIYDSLSAAGYEVNGTLKSFYEGSASGAKRQGNPKIENSGNVKLSTAETPQSMYTNAVKDSYAEYNAAALVVFSRIGGEGFDLPRTATGHYLQLDQNEKDLLSAVCNAGFERVIVLLNSSSPMELGFLDDSTYQGKIDGCLWIGSPGMTGIMALGSVLNGETNPSGRLVDTYARDFKLDPTWNNFGNNLTENGDLYTRNSSDTLNAFVEYEEGIYVGYKYYETRGYTDGEAWYRQNVVYPFGYGKSYTGFETVVTNKAQIDHRAITADSKIDIKLQVTNTGDQYSGKEVVEVYATPPYTAGGIEKAHKVLVGFVKTPLLAPGQTSEELTVSIDPYSFASYDDRDANHNGFKGYELEKGNYTFSIAKNAHETLDTVTAFVESDIRLEKDARTGYSVENRFDDADDELEKVLSRNDWEGTWPQSPTAEERSKDKAFINTYKDFTTNNPYAESYTEMPKQATERTSEREILLYDMLSDKDGNWVGKADYDDERWEKLLDEIVLEDMINMYDYGAFNTADIQYIGKNKTTDADGPVGFHNFLGDDTIYDTCSYASECVLGATWNVELIEEMGKSVGEEALWGNERGDGIPYSGWYAPGVNIHRSPFGGRNFEYFSEDGFLAGELAAAEIKGAMSKGVYCYVKHFALNEQETHRNGYGLYTWATEQSIREIYLKPFEYAVKEGGTTAIMSSFNRIGTKWTGGDYRLLTEVLRNEWGFKGMVICDFNTESYMNSKQMAYAGGDLNLATVPYSWVDASNPADVTILRKCVKNILYTVANSNSMNKHIIGYGLAKWQVFLIVADAVIVAGICIWGALVLLRLRKEN